MAQPFVGEIRPFAGNFAPSGWHLCDGALLSISEYEVLFALIGTTYGGDGTSTFGVPDLRGRIGLHNGTGPGLTAKVLGQKAGSESVTVTTSQMPQHAHSYFASSTPATSISPANAVLATMSPSSSGEARSFYTPVGEPGNDIVFDALTVAQTGGNQPHENMMPSLALTYIIALFGIFPSQS